MLTQLLKTDLLTFEPDAKDIDLFSPEFSISDLPEGIGCYAFYDETGKVWYIGSSCAQSIDPHSRGLRMRMRFYKGRGKSENVCSAVKKIRELNKTTKVLLKVWLCASEGDARKYEFDAIVAHKPSFNICCIPNELTKDEWKAKRREYHDNWLEKMVVDYDPEREKKCCKCQGKKTCKDFNKHRHKKDGVRSDCRSCQSETNKITNAKYRNKKVIQ